MNMSMTTWYVGCFFWSCRVLDRFCSTKTRREYNSRVSRYENSTNLCHFFRMLMWGAVVTTVIVVWYASLVFIVCVLPFYLFSAYSIGTVILGIAAILALAGAIIGLLWSISWLWDRIEDYYRKAPPKPEPEHKGDPRFITVFWHYLKALKEQFCPLIRFGE
jgi:hypothetical protein